MSTKNPTWTVEETVIALKTYVDLGGPPSSKDDPAVIALSAELRALAENSGADITDSFRNPTGIYMKLRNLQGAITDGKQGLKFSKRDKAAVDRFYADPGALAFAAAQASAGKKIASTQVPDGVPDSYKTSELSQIPDSALDAAGEPLPSGASLVTPDPRSLGEICKQEQTLRIPRHQRSYAWTEDEVGDFISDVQGLAGAVASGEEEAKHFFGGIVVVRPPDQKGWYVIDGQQRLTTYMLALGVLQAGFDQLRQLAAAGSDHDTQNAAEGHSNRLRDEFLWTKKVEALTGAEKVLPRLSPNINDQAAFEAVLRNESIPVKRGSQALMVEARDRLWDHLIAPLLASASAPKDGLRALLALQYALLKSCVVVQLAAANPNAAYTLFMVLNDRGMQLSEGDMLRAITLEALEPHPTSFEKAAELWDQILSHPASVVTGFLRTYYPSVYAERVDIWKLVPTYRQDVFGLGAKTLTASDAEKIADRLTSMANEMQTYVKLGDGAWPLAIPTGKKGYTERVRRLVKTLKHDLATPLLLAAAHRLSPKEFGELVILLERFAFRYKNVGGQHVGKAADAYYAHAQSIRSLKPSKAYDPSPFRAKLKDLIDGGPDDELFKDLLSEKLDYERTGQRGNIRWLLAAVEDFGPWLDDKKRAADPELSHTLVFDVESAHIDHIYPQNPDDADVVDELEEVKHSLGNLVLLEEKPNEIAGNTPFGEKRSFYRASRLAETKAVGRKKKWTADRVEEREEDLAGYAVLLTAL